MLVNISGYFHVVIFLFQEFDDDVPAFDDDVTSIEVSVDEDSPKGEMCI